MAIPYHEVKQKYEDKMNAPFTVEELSSIAIVEKKIDHKITLDFKDREISFYLSEVNFSNTNYPNRRQALMFKELNKRYNNAGWKTKVYDTDDDGPNRPGFTFWEIFV